MTLIRKICYFVATDLHPVRKHVWTDIWTLRCVQCLIFLHAYLSLRLLCFLQSFISFWWLIFYLFVMHPIKPKHNMDGGDEKMFMLSGDRTFRIHHVWNAAIFLPVSLSFTLLSHSIFYRRYIIVALTC